MARQNAPQSAWDPVLLVSQIISMQTLHYLTLAVLIPPLLALFAEPRSLEYEGGAANVGMVMDWRHLASRPTVNTFALDPWELLNSVWSGGRQVSSSPDPLKGPDGRSKNGVPEKWDGKMDPLRGWIIAFCWLVAAGVDTTYLYTLVRRPRLVLDFVLTLLFTHLVLTTYYAAALPTSLFFWLVMAICGVGMVVITEQLCVRREMREGLVVARVEDEGEELEMGGLLGSRED